MRPGIFSMDRLLTVLVQTSPIPSHPSTALLEALFRSFDHVDGLTECRIIIICDGCDEHEENASNNEYHQGDETNNYKHGRVSADAFKDYRKHLHLLQSRLDQPEFSFVNYKVQLLKLTTRHGSARAIAAAFDYLSQQQLNDPDSSPLLTPFCMIAQHDNLFVQPVPLRSILQVMERQDHSWIKSLHFKSTATVKYRDKVRLRYGLEISPRKVKDLDWPLIPLAFWYGRTQVARSDYYTNFVLKRPLQVGDHLEELLGETQLDDMIKRGPRVAHDLYGNYLLDQEGEVLYHLSGRRARATATTTTSSSTTTSTNTMSVTEEKYTGETGSSRMLQTNKLPARVPTEQLSRSRNATTLPCSDSSWTTSRSSRAIVPGLELPSAERANRTTKYATNSTTRTDSNKESPPPLLQKRFKQRCFACGEKGHSFKFCAKAEAPNTETIDLS